MYIWFTNSIVPLLMLLASTACIADDKTIGVEPESREATPAPASSAGAGPYSNHARLTKRLRELVQGAPSTARLKAIARSGRGREVWALELARPGDKQVEARSAILVVAGLEATHLIGTETAIGLAEALLVPADQSPTTQADEAGREGDGQEPITTTQSDEVEDLLAEHVVYILPRVNPDGAELFLASVQHEYDGNSRPTDDDRDGLVDEDPPEDLNGDGLITRMRVLDPEEATHFADPDEPRLLREADRAEDQRPVFKLYTEGIDNDGDGAYNEDGVGGILPNHNFPHAYPELAAGAGAHQLSEPGPRALVDFVLSHPNIAAVIVYGRHDNIVKPPGDKERDISGRGYRHLHPDDVAFYKHMSERFKELTGMAGAPESDDAGAFGGWAYNQRGLPTFATTLWWLPEEKEPDEDKKPEPTTQPTTEPTTQPAASQPAATQPAGEKKSEKEKKDKKKDPLENERKWLKYSDEKRDGAGFVPWTAYDHPTLGKVEIGGFAPGFRINPPPEAIAEIVDKQRAFLEDVAGRLPRPRVAGCLVTARSDSVFEIELSLANDAYFPTALAMAKDARKAYPFVLRLGLPAERILGGRRVHKVATLDALGTVEKVRWLVAGTAGEEIKLEIYHKRFGTIDYVIRLEETTGDVEAGGRQEATTKGEGD